MLTVRVVPRAGVVARSALATAEITTTLVVAHTAAGGELPGVPWIAAMAGVVFVAGLAVLKGRVRTAVAVPVLVVAQLGLHCYLAELTMSDGGAPMAGMHGGGLLAHLGLSVPMVLAHLAGAVVTAMVWEVRRRSRDVLVAWREPGLVAQPGPTRRRPLVVTHRRPTTSRVVVVAPRRGPPVLAVPA